MGVETRPPQAFGVLIVESADCCGVAFSFFFFLFSLFLTGQAPQRSAYPRSFILSFLSFHFTFNPRFPSKSSYARYIFFLSKASCDHEHSIKRKTTCELAGATHPWLVLAGGEVFQYTIQIAYSIDMVYSSPSAWAQAPYTSYSPVFTIGLSRLSLSRHSSSSSTSLCSP